MKITIDFDNKTINPVSEVNIQELSQKIQEMFPNDHWEWKIEVAPYYGVFPTYPTYPTPATPIDPFYGQHPITCLQKRTV